MVVAHRGVRERDRLTDRGSTTVNILRHPATLMFLILVVVVLFGYKRLPDVAKSVGQSMKIFKGEMKSLKEDDAPANPVAPAAPDVNLQAAAPNTVVQNATTQNGTAPGGSVADATPSAPAAPPAGPTTPSA